MKTYKELKNAIKETGHTTKYFTKAFLDTFTAAKNTAQYNMDHDIDDIYQDGKIWTRHAWDDVRKTDFYLKNGGAYCAFLEIVNSWS